MADGLNGVALAIVAAVVGIVALSALTAPPTTVQSRTMTILEIR